MIKLGPIVILSKQEHQRAYDAALDNFNHSLWIACRAADHFLRDDGRSPQNESNKRAVQRLLVRALTDNQEDRP